MVHRSRRSKLTTHSTAHPSTRVPTDRQPAVCDNVAARLHFERWPSAPYPRGLGGAIDGASGDTQPI